MKPILIITILLLTTVINCNCNTENNNELNIPTLNLENTKAKANEAETFCESHKFNTSFCILIDMSLHSGVKRFIVWDFKNDTILNSFLVTHGCGDYPWNNDYSKESPTFSNTPDSHCSSLGKYKIGERGYSQWGVNVKYVLHGLESSNSNAQSRAIVFHSWEAISDEDLYPNGTPEGWGCPAVSNNSFRIIDPMLKASDKPVLMWIYQ